MGESLFSLVESMDFDLQMGDLGESLMTEAELVANLPDNFLNPPLLPPPTTSPPRAPSPTPSFPVLQLSSTMPTNHIQLRQVGEPGPDGQVVFEVVTENLQLPFDALPDDLGYSSLSSSSSSSSVSPLSPTQEVGEVQGESKEERRLRLQAEAWEKQEEEVGGGEGGAGAAGEEECGAEGETPSNVGGGGEVDEHGDGGGGGQEEERRMRKRWSARYGRPE